MLWFKIKLTANSTHASDYLSLTSLLNRLRWEKVRMAIIQSQEAILFGVFLLGGPRKPIFQKIPVCHTRHSLTPAKEKSHHVSFVEVVSQIEIASIGGVSSKVSSLFSRFFVEDYPTIPPTRSWCLSMVLTKPMKILSSLVKIQNIEVICSDVGTKPDFFLP